MKGAAAELATAFGRFGTGIFYIPSTLSSDASIKNWGGAAGIDYTEEEAYLVSSANLEQFVLKKYNCSNCPLACGAIMDVPSERWELANIDRPEYETMGAFGSQILNSDYESVLRCNLLCNEYGLDTISAGATVSWIVECYENGLFTKEELDGIEATWGNGDSIVALTELICKNEGIGQVLIKGTRYAADHLGKGHEYLVVASGIEEPQHDGRLAYGVTRTYQYDPTPGRHVKGGLGLAPSGPDFDYSDTGEADLQGVVGTEVLNSSGLCMFGNMVSPPDALLNLIEAVTGFQYSPEEFRKLGTRMFNIRHAFNIREGMTRKDFTLSKRFYESNPPYEGPIAGVKVDHERLADNFFETIGWDKETLIPSLSSLEELGGMEAVIADFYG
jgi:aldehyde:ferredoxin oxidoreductase